MQFLGKNTYAWLMDTTVITFDDGLETHLDGILQCQGSQKQMSEAEAAVEEAFAGMKEVVERKVPEPEPEKVRVYASGGSSSKKSKLKKGEKVKPEKPKAPAREKPKPREYIEEEFVVTFGPPLYPVPLVGSSELECRFESHAAEQEKATVVLKRLYAWVSASRSYLDWLTLTLTLTIGE